MYGIERSQPSYKYEEQCPLPEVQKVDLRGCGQEAKASVKEGGAQDGIQTQNRKPFSKAGLKPETQEPTWGCHKGIVKEGWNCVSPGKLYYSLSLKRQLCIRAECGSIFSPRPFRHLTKSALQSYLQLHTNTHTRPYFSPPIDNAFPSETNIMERL